MANKPGIGYESQILNAREEKVVEALSVAIMEYGQPAHGDMTDDPVVPFTNVFTFAQLWDGVYPGIGKEIMFEKKYAFAPMWGALTSLSALYGGIRFLHRKYKDGELPEQAQKAVDDFRALLIDEANETGRGDQKFVSERWERFQK